MLSRAQNTFHHNPRLRGPVSSIYLNFDQKVLFKVKVYAQQLPDKEQSQNNSTQVS